jgi:hypothetical protein
MAPPGGSIQTIEAKGNFVCFSGVVRWATAAEFNSRKDACLEYSHTII